MDEEDDLNIAIEKTDDNLKNFISLLLEITFELTSFYMTQKRLLDVEYIKEITTKKNKENICSFILNNMFKKDQGNNDKVTSFNNADLTSAFMMNRWFLTPGYFRESAFELAKDN